MRLAPRIAGWLVLASLGLAPAGAQEPTALIAPEPAGVTPTGVPPLLATEPPGTLPQPLGAAAPPPLAPSAFLPAPRETIGLAVGTGRLFRLSRAAANLFVADPNIANIEAVSPRVAYVFGNAPGRTDVFALDDRGELVAGFALIVSRDVQPAREANARLNPAAGTRFDAVGDQVLGTGPVGGVGEAVETDELLRGAASGEPRVLNRTTFEGASQINLRVRFAEVARNDLTRFGINWDALARIGDFRLGFTSGLFVPGAFLDPGETFGTATGSVSPNNVDIDVLLDALRREGTVNLLAEPNLTARSGESASFLAGGEFPFPVPVEAEIVGIEFRQFGVSLDFLPTLLPNERIAIRTRPEVSSLVPDSGIAVAGTVVPALTIRRAETTVEVASGQTFAIAGLFQRDLRDDIRRFPGLGDLPILGNLFRSVRFQRDETELVILITPFLVEPVAEASLAGPNTLPSSLAGPVAGANAVAERAGFILRPLGAAP